MTELTGEAWVSQPMSIVGQVRQGESSARFTITCGCTRTMVPSPRHGRGAFRCGCGALVKVAETPKPATQCVGSRPDGTDCGFPVVQVDPLPLCDDHYESTGLKRYHEWLEKAPEEVALAAAELRELAFLGLTSAEGLSADDVIEARCSAERAWRERDWSENYPAIDAARRKEIEDDLEARGLVYFVRINDLIKIGKTLQLKQRITSYSYPGLKVLATERGYTVREAVLHNQFAAFRRSGEWFEAAQPLLDYIATLEPYVSELRLPPRVKTKTTRLARHGL